MKSVKEYLRNFPAAFAEEAEQYGLIKEFSEDSQIVKEGQYVKFIPLVLEGTVKVFTRHEEKELLLYYIESGESCIMSFNAGLKNSPSRVYAIAEENSALLLLPADKMNAWIKNYPSIVQLFFDLYDQRYISLLDTIKHLLYNRLDQRLYSYLVEKSRQKNSPLIHITHRQIANELGTVREVITRVIKKLESEGKIRQSVNGIEILAGGDAGHQKG